MNVSLVWLARSYESSRAEPGVCLVSNAFYIVFYIVFCIVESLMHLVWLLLNSAQPRCFSSLQLIHTFFASEAPIPWPYSPAWGQLFDCPLSGTICIVYTCSCVFLLEALRPTDPLNIYVTSDPFLNGKMILSGSQRALEIIAMISAWPVWSSVTDQYQKIAKSTFNHLDLCCKFSLYSA